MNELAQIVQTNELEPQDGKMIIDRFGSYEKVAQEWDTKAKAIVVTDRNQTTEMAMAREARKKFSNMRIELEKARKSIGEPAFRKYKAVNAVAKYLQALIQPIEDHLRLQEDFVKNDDARIDAEKKVEEERKIEAERVAKEEAERKEQERIRQDNIRLQKEAEAREKAMQIEREEAQKVQAELEEKVRKEAEAREKIEAEVKAKAEAERQEKIKAEQAESERVEAERKAQQEALKAPDKEKFVRYVQDLLNVPTPLVKDEGIKSDIEKIKGYLQIKL